MLQKYGAKITQPPILIFTNMFSIPSKSLLFLFFQITKKIVSGKKSSRLIVRHKNLSSQKFIVNRTRNYPINTNQAVNNWPYFEFLKLEDWKVLSNEPLLIVKIGPRGRTCEKYPSNLLWNFLVRRPITGS